MANFHYTLDDNSGKFTLCLAGHIDEDVTFKHIDIDGAKELHIDFKKVDSINSCGIREWIIWIRSVSADIRIIYENCPKAIVDQINMVSGFLPDTAKVVSFYVPYYNEDTGREKMVLFIEGDQYTENDINIPFVIKEESGDVFEVDVIESKYFKFLKVKAS